MALFDYLEEVARRLKTPGDRRKRNYSGLAYLLDVAGGQASLFQVLLVVILCCVEFRRGFDLRDNGLSVLLAAF